MVQAEQYQQHYQSQLYEEPPLPEPSPEETGSFPTPVGPNRTRRLGGGTPVPEPDEESYYQVFKQSLDGNRPTPREFSDFVGARYGIAGCSWSSLRGSTT